MTALVRMVAVFDREALDVTLGETASALERWLNPRVGMTGVSVSWSRDVEADHYERPDDPVGTVFDPASPTFGPIMAAIQAGEFERAASLLAAVAPSQGNAATTAVPLSLLARLMAAIETPGDLTKSDVTALLEDVNDILPDDIELPDFDTFAERLEPGPYTGARHCIADALGHLGAVGEGIDPEAALASLREATARIEAAL